MNTAENLLRNVLRLLETRGDLQRFYDKITGLQAWNEDTASVSVEKPWAIVERGSDGQIAAFSPKFNVVKARFTAGSAIGVKVGDLVYITPAITIDTK